VSNCSCTCLPAGRFLDSARCKECTGTYKFKKSETTI
jgi:hypothetical protein